MIFAGTRPPDRAERARARAERARLAEPVEPGDGPPEVGQQRAWNQTFEGPVDGPVEGSVDDAADGTSDEDPETTPGPVLDAPPT